MDLYQKIKPYVSLKEVFDRIKTNSTDNWIGPQIISNYVVRAGLCAIIGAAIGTLAGDSHTGAEYGRQLGGLEFIGETLFVNRELIIEPARQTFSKNSHRA